MVLFQLFITVNPCASNPCNEGRCVPDKTNFTCDCSPCYNGEYCELPNNNTCENNSTCYGRQNGRNVYIQACRCKPGFHGDRCQYGMIHFLVLSEVGIA